ncbi:P-loop NTPase fold protein [Pandoraea pnomenusa]|uniref:KAP family P-loop NTPase fold protein n=1 Tax=Pandoraea pnomenusa TaxID=93220 RepID=UPI0007BC9CFF|nr:P-loop NTPase fold protein [Pandoraea pnomenusa]ANC45093.1 hypothetical protein A6P55_13815 [Pandoraea pnomenusa]
MTNGKSSNSEMPAMLDREISRPEQDAFGHRHYARALRSLIESSSNTTPFSIGVLGGWGTGKSSIKELYVADLQDDASKQNGLTRNQRIRCITFNAWRFGGKDQDIKRALLRHVFLELGGAEESLQDKLFRQISETTSADKSYWAHTKETLKSWAVPLPAAGIALLLIFVATWLAIWAFGVEGSYARSAIFATMTAAVGYILKNLKPVALSNARSITKVTLPTTTVEQYEDMLLEQIRKFKSGASKSKDGRSGKSCDRIVVFVDDLDRLSSEEMVLGLDGVRTFMEIPKSSLPEGIGLVFVISCDEGKIADALSKGRRNADLPAAVFTHFDARRYLDRIFQFRLDISPPPRHDMRAFAKAHLQRLPDVAQDLESRGVEIDALIDRMIHVGIQDPRNALQVVNAFSQAWWIGKVRELEGVGTDRPGGLHEGAITNHPISLGALCALKVSFPDFYREVQDDPGLLKRLTDVAVNGQPFEGLPESTIQLFNEKYFTPAGNSGKPALRPEHRPLRQFLASLIGLRWAEPLQSLLLLSEDPITRRLGSKVTEVYDAFVSGDTKGFLEAMGRHINTAPLSQEQARNIYQMFEDLRHESSSRRVNAARVIADIIDRLPNPTALQLLSALCREVSESRDLRSHLGPTRLAKLVARSPDADQTAVASRLVDDVLGGASGVKLQLESLQTPNLGEAVAMVEQLTPVILNVRAAYGIESRADASLLSWLVDRTVSVNSDETQLPFGNLENWIEGSPEPLFADLGEQYLEALVVELEKDATPEFNLKSAMARASSIFTSRMSLGQETRHVLWSLLERFIALDSKLSMPMAAQVSLASIDKATDMEASAFIEAFAVRMTPAKNEGITENDEYRSLVEQLLAITSACLYRLSGEAPVSLADLANALSKEASTSQFSCELVRRLHAANSDEAWKPLGEWAERLLSDLPLDCVALLGNLYPELPDSTKSAVVKTLNILISKDLHEEGVAKRLTDFVDAVPRASWDNNPLQPFLNQLLPQIAARSNNANRYLMRVVPATSKIFSHASRNVLGNSLHQLFEQAKATPANYSWLHSWMARYWPAPSSELTPYNPVAIFDDGHTFANNHPADAKSGLLFSMREMIAKGIAPADRKSKLAQAACVVWKNSYKDAVTTFQFNPDLSAQQTAGLAESIDWGDAEAVTTIRSVWSSVAKAMPDDSRSEVTRLLLVSGPRNVETVADIAIVAWLDVQPDEGDLTLRSLLPRNEVSDEHKARLWQQVIRRADTLAPAFFMDILPSVVRQADIPRTSELVFDNEEVITSQLQGDDQRAKLARNLIAEWSEIKTNTIKSRVAAYSAKLAGKGALKGVELEQFSDDDLTILENHFGTSKDIARIRRTRAITQSE